ncbi:uncharacterized protein LOC127242153 isoform X2 [Andrographis paniculata]|uniref:uncharacterized protein LOC127242153 isoform X2 n=1 Tax=Andrographis paniculata TaxID=175694 RepID=UPI0021E72D40|nr:uncharacterized protein LOC127242153 isoform X2 [Andrographis paniculata]XP_051117532.1 uncharacterized protein LOC127242153 isoform X2 [Andrographis paniculata]
MRLDDIERQVMFRQLQDLQRRQQQLQELGDTQNPNFINQLSSKHASIGQFPHTLNGGTPLQDSTQMSLFGNMETMPGGLVLTQNRNPDAVGPVDLLPHQFDISSYGNSHLQGPSNLSVNMQTKNSNSLGVGTLQPSPYGSSFMNQQFSFPSDRIRMPDGQVSVEGCNRESLSGNYSEQGIVPMQGNASLLESEGGHQDADWGGFSPGKSSNLGTASLDPLEQKILYGTDDSIWESSSNRSSKISTGGFQTTVDHASQVDSLPSIQSGSWSALMLSAVEETSSSETGVQEEWSRLSFKNPGSLNGIQLPNYNEPKMLQNNWVDRNSQNTPPPSSGTSRHLFQNLNANHSFPNFQESGQQYGSSHATMDHFPGNSGQFIDYSSQQTISTQGTQVNQPPLLSSMSPDSGFRLQAADPQASQAYSFFPTLGSSSATFVCGSSDSENQHPALPAPQSIGFEFPPCSASATLQHSGGQEFPPLEKSLVNQPSFKSDMLQRTVQPTPWPDIAAQQHASARKPNKFSNMFGFPNPASSSHEATEHPNKKSFQQEQESGPSLRKLEGSDQQINSSEINSSISHGSENTQEYEKNRSAEASAIGYDPLTNQQLSDQLGGGNNDVPPGDIGAYGNSLSQSYSLLHQVHSSRNETDGGKSCLSKYNLVNHQRPNVNAMELLLSGQKSGVKDAAKNDPHVVPQLGSIFSGSFPQETQLNELSRGSLTAIHQKQAETFGSNEAASYPSHNSLHKAPSWITNYRTLKDGNLLPTCEPTPVICTEHQFSNLQQNNLTMQVNLAQGNERGGYYPSTAAVSILCKKEDSPSVVASDVMTSQKLPVSLPKKRKLAEFSMVAWRKEMIQEPSELYDVSTVELLWAQALNRRPMEVKDEADVVEEYTPPIRAKRRLICNTQLMQLVFGPMPAFILQSDATSSPDIVPCFAARLTLGNAWNLTSQLSKKSNDTSPDKPNNSKRRKDQQFLEIVEGFISQQLKLKSDLFRTPKVPCYAALKVEAQELEKFSIINRFAKIHIKATQPTPSPTSVDPAAAAATHPAPKSNIQRYVVAVPMPSTVPEGVDCLSL